MYLDDYQKLKLSVALSVVLAAGCSSDDDSGMEANINTSSPDAESLVDRAWDLRRYTAGDGSLVDVNSETKYQIFMEGSSSNLNGFIGCVSTDGSYEIRDGYVTVELGDRDAQVCITDQPEHVEQSSTVEGLLNGNVPLIYITTDEALTLTTAGGRELVFAEIAEIEQQE